WSQGGPFVLGGNTKLPNSGFIEPLAPDGPLLQSIIKLGGDEALRKDGQALMWPREPETTLLSTPDLKADWKPYDGNIGHTESLTALFIDHDEPARFYRLSRQVENENDTAVPPIQIGVLLSWSFDDSILEMSPGPAGPWEAFQGVQGQIDGRMAAVISQAQIQNYFRTRKVN
ncbi:MAG: hypothetical protein KDA77_20420, partial [Planctomycetaceae bacterium]|nr:hypothetical protein [Planctomycetaceae bacterium]